MAKNNLENKEILSDEMIRVIDLIIAKDPNVIFGGSIALNAVGLLNRKIKDIDLFFPLDYVLPNNVFTINENDISILSDTINKNGNTIERIGAKINNIDICCFKVSNDDLLYSNFKFFGRNIRIQNINIAIIAKRCYSSINPKHEADLLLIENTINKIFS